MSKPSKEVAALRDRLDRSLRPTYGVHWIAALAERANVKEKSLRTTFARGRKMPPYKDRLNAAARDLLGIAASGPTMPAGDRIAALLERMLEALEPLAGVPRQLDDLKAEVRRAREAPPDSAGGASPAAQ